MLEAVRFVTPEWVHQYVEPYHEGAARLNRAWTGTNIRSVDPAKRSLKLIDRVISLLVGVVLMLPFINTIVWIAWRAFGTPEKLSDRYCPEVDSPPLLPPPVVRRGSIQILPTAPVAASSDAVRRTELLAYHEISKEGLTTTNWKFEFSPDLIMVAQLSDTYSSTSLYNTNWAIKEFHDLKENGDQFDIWLRESNRLETRLVKNGKETRKEILLEPNLPWVQQGTVGLREFVKGNQTEFRFYGISPINKFWYLPRSPSAPFAAPFIAKKVGEEEVAGYGRLIKVEVMCTWGWPYNSTKGELWFEPQTGIMRKFVNPIEEKHGECILERPLPAPTHP